MEQTKTPVSLQLMMTAVSAALYAAVGVISAPIPLFLGVRFWPPVFIPGVFSVLFGPWIGGIGAGIGIFIADVFYGHHDALLSLLVGVPSNFIGFFLVGWLTHHVPSGPFRRLALVTSLLVPPIIVSVYFLTVFLTSGWAGFSTAQYAYAAVGLIVVVTIIGIAVARNKWADFEIAASIGLGAGSLVIGVGLVAYSRMFTLPSVVGSGPFPVEAIYLLTAYVYFSEILFLLFVTPPVVAACKAAFPSVRMLGATISKANKGQGS